MNSLQKKLCLKIRKHQGSNKAALYFAALIGTGLRPSEAPAELKRIFAAAGFRKEGDFLRRCDGRGYVISEAFAAAREKLGDRVNIKTEIMFQRHFEGGEATWA